MTDFNLNADYFAAAAECRSTEASRYYLNGVFVAPHPCGGVYMIATDGHVLAAFYDEDGYAARPAILTTDFKAKDLKTSKSESRNRRLKINGDTGKIVGLDASGDEVLKGLVIVETIDGTFPDWTLIIPSVSRAKRERSTIYCWDASLIAMIAKSAARAKLAGRRQGLSFTQNDEREPAIVEAEGLSDAVWIIMPLRDFSLGVPSWLLPKSEAA